MVIDVESPPSTPGRQGSKGTGKQGAMTKKGGNGPRIIERFRRRIVNTASTLRWSRQEIEGMISSC